MRLGLVFAFFVLLTGLSVAASNDIVGVASVIDGDTIEIHGERIRLFGIDAPEHDQACTDAAGAKYLCGQKAAFALADMLKEKTVHCENRGDGGYGRTLGLCRVGAKDVGAAMVDQGWALAYVDYSNDYVANEARARDAKLGMWQGSFVKPWDERHGTSTNESAAQQVQPNATISSEPSVAKICNGRFPGCCRGHGGIDPRRINDGNGYIKCNGTNNYAKRPSCHCE